MTKAQDRLYWREWGAVRKAHREADRHRLHVQALGYSRSHTEFTNTEFDKVLGAFRALSRPASVASQIRQQDQPRTRMEHRLAEIQACLGLYVTDVAGFVARVAADKFGVPVNGSFTLDDLSFEPTLRKNWQTKALEESPSQVEQLLMTLWARLQPYRRDAGHSLHEMRILAGVACDCARCIQHGRPVPMPAAVPVLQSANAGDDPF